jgi:hypothetical protein
MAIFNRSKERWYPTKPLNKVRKNRTIHLERDISSSVSPKAFAQNKRLWFWLDAKSIDNTDVYDFWYLNSDCNDYEKTTLIHEGVDPTIERIRAARFAQKSIRFSYDGNQGYLETGSPIGNIGELMFTEDSGSYGVQDSAMWISFWYKSPDPYPGSSPTHGHSVGGFVKFSPDDTGNTDEPHETKPVLGIYIDGSKRVSLRMSTPTAVSPPTIDTDIYFAETSTSRTILEADWNFISICLPTDKLNGGTGAALSAISLKDLVNRARIWINGIEDVSLVKDTFGDFSADDAFSTDNHYLVLGNSTGFWGTRDNAECRPCVGFEGWLGEFLVMNYHDDNLGDVAKFLYEAYREGVFAVHSGTHSSEPLREIKEQRKIRYYPPNNGGVDQHVLTTVSGSVFEEGRSMLLNDATGLYETPEPFDYDASKFFEQSSIIVPHLKVSPNDEILMHWLASDRSVFFSEDLTSPSNDGFTTEPDASKISTSDHLYPSHEQQQTVGPFNDISVNTERQEYSESFTLDIPISYGTTACELGTESIGEAPFISGASNTFEYSGLALSQEFNFQDGNSQVTLKWDYATANDETYWVDSTDSSTLIEYQKKSFFKYDGNDPSDTGAQSFVISAEELDYWLKILTFLTHCIHVYHGSGGATQLKWWNNFVQSASGPSTQDFYAENAFYTNLISVILEIGIAENQSYTSLATPLTLSSANEEQIASAIWLLREQDNMALIDPANGTSSQVDCAVFNQLGDPSLVDTGIYPNPNFSHLETVGNTLLLPSNFSNIADVFPEKLDLLIDLYTNSAAAHQWWMNGKVVETKQFGGYNYLELQKTTPGSLAVSNPNIAIKTMAYHNFSSGEWEPVNTYSTTFQSQPDPSRFVENASIGFSPMSSLMYPYQATKLEEVIDSAGRPTDSFGFPFHEKYEANAGQTFDLSSYFTEPVVLKGWELRMEVVPKTGPDSQSDVAFSVSDSNSYDVLGYDMGNANVLYSESYASPFIAEAANGKQMGNTFPSKPSWGTRALNTSDSQLTKGVTAFLLKESSTVTDGLTVDSYYRNDHKYVYYSNCTDSSSIQDSKQAEQKSESIFSVGPNAIGNNTIFQLGPHRSLTSANSFYDNQSTRELLGYLQHVYHNDKGWNEDDIYRARTDQANILNLNQLGTSQTANFSQLFGRENSTYISSISSNTSPKEFHVEGLVKTNSKLTNQSIVSPFFLRTNKDSTNDDDLFFSMDQSSQAESQAFVTNYTIVNSWNGGTGTGELLDGMFSSGVVGETLGQEHKIPNFTIPIKSAITTNKKIDPSPVKMSLNPVSHSDVVIYPNDKLILGIQDSVSTVIGSQVVDDQGNLWKWGRQKLDIPAKQTGAYLRLYLERRQNNKSIVPRTNQSHGFSEDVNEGLGNTLILDKFETAPTRVYSGSMADDIMALSPLVPAGALLRVQHAQFQADSLGAAFDPTGYVIPEFPTPLKRNYLDTRPNDPNGDTIPYPDLVHNWLFLHEKIFKDRTPSAHEASHTANGTDSFYKKPNFEENASGNIPVEYSTNGDLAKLGALKVGMWPVTASSTKINPYPSYTKQNITSRWGGTCALWELNRNPSRLVPTSSADKMTIDDEGVDFSFSSTEECPAFSSWKFKVVFPLFHTASSSIRWDQLKLTIRLIALDKDSKPQAYNPESSSYEELVAGDFFTFHKSATESTGASRAQFVYKNGVGAVSSWSEQSYGQDETLYSDVYCVAAEGLVLSGYDDGINQASNYHFSSDAETSPSFNPWDASVSLTWDSMMGKIKEILEQESRAVEGLNYTITNDNPEQDWFQISFINDDFSISQLDNFKDTINSDLEFSLLGTSGDLDIGDVPDSAIWAYRVGDLDENTGYDSNALTYYGYSQFQEEIPDGGGGFLVQDIDNADETNNLGPMMNDEYLRTQNTFSGGTAPVSGGPDDHAHTDKKVKIDYRNLPKKKAVQLEIKHLQMSPPSVSSRAVKIDRKVEFRTTEGTAGPYGSLNKFMKLSGNSRNSLFIDSIPRNNFTVASGHLVSQGSSTSLPRLDLSIPIWDTQCWPFLEYPDDLRMQALPIEGVFIPGTDNGGGDITLSLPIPSSAASRNDAKLLSTDEEGSTVTFYVENNETSVELKDYILEKFPATANVEKIVDDLSGAFGDGGNGKLVFRPSIFTYKSFDANNGNLDGETTHFFMKLDPVRGSRFGLYNCSKAYRSAVFSRASYGNSSDFLEQSLDTAGITINSDLFGACIKYLSRNPNDPRIPTELGENNRRNIDKFQRIYAPLFDRTGIDIYDYGVVAPSGDQIQDNLPNLPANTNPETGDEYEDSGSQLPKKSLDSTVTVSLPGQIATRSVVTPGTVNRTIKRFKE